MVYRTIACYSVPYDFLIFFSEKKNISSKESKRESIACFIHFSQTIQTTALKRWDLQSFLCEILKFWNISEHSKAKLTAMCQALYWFGWTYGVKIEGMELHDSTDSIDLSDVSRYKCANRIECI